MANLSGQPSSWSAPASMTAVFQQLLQLDEHDRNVALMALAGRASQLAKQPAEAMKDDPTSSGSYSESDGSGAEGVASAAAAKRVSSGSGYSSAASTADPSAEPWHVPIPAGVDSPVRGAQGPSAAGNVASMASAVSAAAKAVTAASLCPQADQPQGVTPSAHILQSTRVLKQAIANLQTAAEAFQTAQVQAQSKARAPESPLQP
eukprot:CAMPEP_0198555770 /NCGR_PEP_ID=MMETSP1462-20131121/85425_1 /TAXON_ID=1333877 /ORGANISM="Brandtodinium nutriculum, Strain RCC3387" /LENGTH=204 /DNA_ID=CAMNT_0044286501 /DNA_START=56 /DNA_END=666 /DNA_ORIENTATION=+